MRSLITTGAILLFAFIMMIATCKYVSPTEAAFKIERSGNERGVSTHILYPGFNWYLPWKESVESVGTTMHHTVWSDDKNEGDPTDQSIQIFCLGGAGFHVNVGLNVSVIPEKAPWMYLKWKTLDIDLIMKTYLRNVVRGNMQNVSSTMSVDSVLNSFNVLEAACRQSVSDSLAHYGFHLDGFNILSKPKAIDQRLENAVNEKVIAKQNSETETMNIRIHDAKALQRAADARGDSSYNVIEAMGKAEAVKVMQAQLTPTYVEYVKWSNAAPTTPRVPEYVGAGGWVMQPK